MTAKTNFPAGHMLVNGVSMHVARVREFTTDLRRFRRVLPLTERIEQYAPQSPEWCATLNAIFAENPTVTPEQIAATLEEAGAIAEACAAELRRLRGRTP